MRLGINGDFGHKNPDEWIKLVEKFGVKAVVAPMTKDAPPEVRQDYLKYIHENDLVIGEVGIWKNSIDKNEQKRKEAIEFSKQQLAFADEIEARCCVNIAGSAGEIWDAYYPENYSEEVYTLIVDTTREIIDSVKPTRTFYTLEPMYWMHPDSPEDYLKLLKDIDRKEAAVHLDYINMINGFEKYHNRKQFIKECFDKLGPYTKSIHAKDIILDNAPPCCLKEMMPGKGVIDFHYILELASQLPEDVPVFVEHLTTLTEYEMALQCLKDAL